MRIRLAAAVVAASAALALSGCSTPETKGDPFVAHWNNVAETRTGHSASVTDLNPEPRVLMSQQDPGFGGDSHPLPQMPVTLKLHGVNVDVALRSMAAAAGVNIMLSPGVTGTVSLNVQKVRWCDVFRGILHSNGLEYRWQGKILQVLTAAEKQKEINLLQLSNRLSEQRNQASRVGPTGVSLVNIRYADATDLQKSLMKMVAKNKEATIEVDTHNNALILQAPRTELRRLTSLIDALDRPRPQVQLKAYIVETTKQKARELGTQWGVAARSRATSAGRRGYIGSGGSAGTFGTDPVTGGFGTSGGLSGIPMGLNYSEAVNATSTSGLGLAWGNIGGNILEAQLSMMEKDGVLNILSSPSITTLDNKMAFTENGEKVPYVSTDGDGDNNVKFEDAVLRLEMTPNVIDANNLKLKVIIKKDEVDSSRAVEGNPYIIKKQTETNLIVRSGETIVISGLTKEKGTDTEAGVPGLRSLPGGKYLFGATNKTVQMEEVLIFITPTILPVRQAGEQVASPLPPSPSTLAEPVPEHKKIEAAGTVAQ